MGGGHDLHTDLGGVSVPGSGDRCLQPQDSGLGLWENDDITADHQRPEHGVINPQARIRGSPF